MTNPTVAAKTRSINDRRTPPPNFRNVKTVSTRSKPDDAMTMETVVKSFQLQHVTAARTFYRRPSAPRLATGNDRALISSSPTSRGKYFYHGPRKQVTLIERNRPSARQTAGQSMVENRWREMGTEVVRDRRRNVDTILQRLAKLCSPEKPFALSKD